MALSCQEIILALLAVQQLHDPELSSLSCKVVGALALLVLVVNVNQYLLACILIYDTSVLAFQLLRLLPQRSLGPDLIMFLLDSKQVFHNLILSILAGDLQRIVSFVVLSIFDEELVILQEHVHDFKPIVSSREVQNVPLLDICLRKHALSVFGYQLRHELVAVDDSKS